MSNRKSLLLVAFLAVAAGLPLWAQSRPDFTGTWKLNEAATGTPAGGVHDIVFKIEHRDPAFKYAATGKRGFALFSESYEFTTDRKMPRDGSKVAVAASWEGQTLVMKYVKDGKEIAKFLFRLAADGKQMTREGEVGNNKIREIYDRQ